MKQTSANAEMDRALFSAKLDHGEQVGKVSIDPTGELRVLRESKREDLGRGILLILLIDGVYCARNATCVRLWSSVC